MIALGSVHHQQADSLTQLQRAKVTLKYSLRNVLYSPIPLASRKNHETRQNNRYHF